MYIHLNLLTYLLTYVHHTIVAPTTYVRTSLSSLLSPTIELVPGSTVGAWLKTQPGWKTNWTMSRNRPLLVRFRTSDVGRRRPGTISPDTLPRGYVCRSSVRIRRVEEHRYAFWGGAICYIFKFVGSSH